MLVVEPPAVLGRQIPVGFARAGNPVISGLFEQHRLQRDTCLQIRCHERVQPQDLRPVRCEPPVGDRPSTEVETVRFVSSGVAVSGIGGTAWCRARIRRQCGRTG